MNVGAAHNRMPPSTSAIETASSERVLGCPTLKSKWVPMFGPMVVSASLTSKRNISSFSHSRLQSRSPWRCKCRPPEVLKSSFCQIPSTGTLFRYQFLFPSTGTRLAADLLYPSRKRFPLPDLAAAQPLVAYETYKSMECEPAESSIGDVETLRSTVIAMRLPCLQQHLSILRAKTPLKPQAGGRGTTVCQIFS